MSRIKSLDLARGFVVLMMAPVHTMLFFSQPILRETLLGKIFAFIAEWHGAQIFMLVMGISFVYSGKQTMESVFQRAAKLFIIAYGLNVIKYVIPHLLGWLPQAFLHELQIDTGMHGYLQLFLLGDILHFAAISIIVLFMISLFQASEKIAIWFSIAILFLGPLLWDSTSNNAFINYDLELLDGQPPVVFFPLFPWLIYPLLGLSIGKLLLNSQNQKSQTWLGFDSFWIVGLGLMMLAFLLKYFLHDHALSSFYRTSPIDSILHVGFTLIAISIWHWISSHVQPNAFFKLFIYCSRHITQIYVIQWILICGLIPIIGYDQTATFGTIGLIFLTSAITLLTSVLIDLAKSKKSLFKKTYL